METDFTNYPEYATGSEYMCNHPNGSVSPKRVYDNIVSTTKFNANLVWSRFSWAMCATFCL